MQIFGASFLAFYPNHTNTYDQVLTMTYILCKVCPVHIKTLWVPLHDHIFPILAFPKQPMFLFTRVLQNFYLFLYMYLL